MSKMSEVVEAVSSALSPSLSSVARLIIVFGQLSDDTRTESLLRKRVVEDLTSSWNASLSLCDLNKELKSFVTGSPIKNATPTGEETLVYQSSAVHTEILVNLGTNPVNDKLTGLRSDGKDSPFTLVVYVGLTLPPTGLWLLRDGPYLPNACGSSLSGPCPTAFEISGRPGVESTLDRKGINEFCGRLFEMVRMARMVKDPELKPSSCAPQFYDRPTMYVFPSGQGTSAFFGMADFSLLTDAGYGRNPACWDLLRRRERLDVLLVTHLGIHNLFGMKSMLEKMKAMDESSRPKIGHAFLNCWRWTKGKSAAVKKDLIADKGVNIVSDSRNQTMLNWGKEAMSIFRDLEQLKINPHPCVSHGIETHVCLYHKVGVGSACIEVLWPNNDERLKQFLETWKDESTDVDFTDRIPAWDAFSVCAVLHWISAPQGKRLRVLLTGGAPESVVFAGLEKLKRKEKQGTLMDSRTCLCKDLYKDSHAVHETTKKHDGAKKGYNGGRIQSKEKHVVAKESASKENGAVKSGLTVTAQREVKQHVKPPLGISCGKSGEAKRRAGPRGRSGFKMEAGQAKGLDAKVETLQRAERDDLDECVGSKRGDALQKANKVERADHAPKNAEHQVADNTLPRSMKRANKAQKAAKGSSAQMKKSWNVSAIEEAKKDAGKSIDHHASKEKKDVGKPNDVHASGEIKADVGKSSDVCAGEEIKEDVGKSIDHHASGEIKEDVGKSSDVCAGEEIKDVGKPNDVHASGEIKEDVGKSSDVYASGETKDVVKSKDDCASEEIKADVGKSNDDCASEEIKADVGKSNDVHANEEIKEDVGKSCDVCASGEIKEDFGKPNDVCGSGETKDVGNSNDDSSIEELKADVGKSNDVCASEETKDVVKSNDVIGSEEKKDVGKSSRANAESKEDFSKSSDAFVSKETNEDIGKSSDVHASEETQESVGKSGDSLESNEGKQDLVIGAVPGSVDPTSCESHTHSKDELCKMEEELGPLEEEQQSRGCAVEQILEQGKEAAGRELKSCHEKAKELNESDVGLPGTKGEAELPFVHEEIALPPKEVELQPKEVELPPNEIELPQKEVELPPKEVELPPREVELQPEEVELPLKEVELPPKEVELPPKEVELPPKEVELPPKEIELSPKEIELSPKEIELPPNNIQLPLVETDAVVSCGVIEAAGPSSEKDMKVLAAAKEDQDVPPAKYEMVLPSEESATKDDMDIPPAEEGVVSPSELPATMEDQDVPPVKDAVATPFEVVVTKEDLDVAIEAAGPSENEVVPPSEVPATMEDLNVPHAEGEMVPPSELPATTENRDVQPSEDELVQPSKVSSTKEDMDLPAGENGVVPPPELPAMKADHEELSAEGEVILPSEMPATKEDVAVPAAEEVVPSSKVSASKEDMAVPPAEKGVVPPSEMKVTKSPKKAKQISSAGQRRKVLSESQTLPGKLHKTPARAYDLDRADSLDDLPSISKTDQLSDYGHCPTATHTFSSTATTHDPDFNVEILRGGIGNDFPAMNPFQGVDYKEDIFTAPRSLAGDCDLHFSIERRVSLSSDVERDSLDGDGESFDPGQTWEPMNLPEPELPKHLSDAKVGDEPKEQRKKTNVRNSRKPCPDDVDKNRKSKPARETHANNDKSKGIIAHSTSSDKITVQKSTKAEAMHSGLSKSPVPVPESKISDPKFTHRSKLTNDEPVYFTVAFIPGRGEPQYVSKVFFQKVRARYYILSSVSHELSVLDSLLEAKEEWEEEQGVKFPVSVIPTHGSKALEEWVTSRSEKLSRLNVDVRKAADECKVCFGAADEKDAFDAFQLDL